MDPPFFSYEARLFGDSRFPRPRAHRYSPGMTGSSDCWVASASLDRASRSSVLTQRRHGYRSWPLSFRISSPIATCTETVDASPSVSWNSSPTLRTGSGSSQEAFLSPCGPPIFHCSCSVSPRGRIGHSYHNLNRIRMKGANGIGVLPSLDFRRISASEYQTPRNAKTIVGGGSCTWRDTPSSPIRRT